MRLKLLIFRNYSHHLAHNIVRKTTRVANTKRFSDAITVLIAINFLNRD